MVLRSVYLRSKYRLRISTVATTRTALIKVIDSAICLMFNFVAYYESLVKQNIFMFVAYNNDLIWLHSTIQSPVSSLTAKSKFQQNFEI